MNNNRCLLCDLVGGNVITREYYRNFLVIIVDCATCHIPLLVFRRHGEATEGEKRLAENIINQLFDYVNIRRVARKIPEHPHWHIEGSTLRR